MIYYIIYHIQMIYPLVNKHRPWKITQFLMETSLPTPKNARVYVNLPEGSSLLFSSPSTQTSEAEISSKNPMNSPIFPMGNSVVCDHWGIAKVTTLQPKTELLEFFS